MFRDPFYVPPHLDVWKVTWQFNYLTEATTKVDKIRALSVKSPLSLICSKFCFFTSISSYRVSSGLSKTCCVVQAGPELESLLFKPSECWGYRCAAAHLAFVWVPFEHHFLHDVFLSIETWLFTITTHDHKLLSAYVTSSFPEKLWILPSRAQVFDKNHPVKKY